ncbi:Helitron helicase [Phytophthora megakarya]|uniref:ATP-dependent DNA helicase n=1 Tax=Phytophthora megakarya TaxID=4795 RepID=A0A225V7Z6_9STRA|nr:Helitron helicase [Phytophthora megakarya]
MLLWLLGTWRMTGNGRNAYRRQSHLKCRTHCGIVLVPSWFTRCPTMLLLFGTAVNHPVDGQKLFFVDGPGGTGKSFLLEQMLAHVRLQKKSQKAELIRNASLIIWDEAPMMHRPCFEAGDRSFRDIMKNDLEPFEGKRPSTDTACAKGCYTRGNVGGFFKSSPLWNHLKKVRLTENMRSRYQVNSDISENDICLPRDMYIKPEERDHYRWDDEEHKESEGMEAPPNFNLLPAT